MAYQYEDQQVKTNVTRAAPNKEVFNIDATALGIADESFPGVVDGTTANLSSGIIEKGLQTIEKW